jgi:protein associated with RNAse G/E
VLRAVDLDLDVIKMSSEHLSDPLEWMAAPGETFVDDEDEFEEHRVALNYPEGVVAAAQASCQELKAAVRDGVPPYDGTHERWLAELSRLAAS